MKLSDITKSLSEQDKSNLKKWKQETNYLMFALIGLGILGMVGVYYLAPTICNP